MNASATQSRIFPFSLSLLLLAVSALPTTAQSITLRPEPVVAGSAYGSALSVNPDRIAVGDYLDDTAGPDAGAVYIYDQMGTNWVLDAKLVLPGDAAANEEAFGLGLSLDGDRLSVISADPASQQRWVYLFRRTATGWEQEAKFTHMSSGRSLSLRNDELLVGLPAFGPNDSQVGAVRPYRLASGVWTEASLFQIAAPAPEDFFGISVSVDGAYALIGTVEDGVGENSGSAYVFQKVEGTWTEGPRLVPDEVEGGDVFGRSSSLSGTVAVLGASGDDDRGTDAGAAYVYERDGAQWSLVQKLTGSDIGTGAFFGSAVRTNGTSIIVGAPNARSGQGAAYVYDQIGTSWTERIAVTSPGSNPDRDYGAAVGITESLVVAGAPPRINSSSVGEVYVYALATVANEEESAAPTFTLTVAPNPMTEAGTVHFSVPAQTPVRLSVFDVLGREVLPASDAVFGPGSHTLPLDVRGLPAGVYTLRLVAGDRVETRRFTRLR